MLKQVLLAHFEPESTPFGARKRQKCLEDGLNLGLKMGHKWIKSVFATVILNHLGCTKKWKEPILSQFSPFGHMYARSCTLQTYLKSRMVEPHRVGERGVDGRIYIYIYIYPKVSDIRSVSWGGTSSLRPR